MAQRRPTPRQRPTRPGSVCVSDYLGGGRGDGPAGAGTPPPRHATSPSHADHRRATERRSLMLPPACSQHAGAGPAVDAGGSGARLRRISDAFETISDIDAEIEETCTELRRLKVEKLRLINQELESEFETAHGLGLSPPPSPFAMQHQAPERRSSLDKERRRRELRGNHLEAFRRSSNGSTASNSSSGSSFRSTGSSNSFRGLPEDLR